jgi:hypothetical protein
VLPFSVFKKIRPGRLVPHFFEYGISLYTEFPFAKTARVLPGHLGVLLCVYEGVFASKTAPGGAFQPLNRKATRTAWDSQCPTLEIEDIGYRLSDCAGHLKKKPPPPPPSTPHKKIRILPAGVGTGRKKSRL